MMSGLPTISSRPRGSVSRPSLRHTFRVGISAGPLRSSSTFLPRGPGIPRQTFRLPSPSGRPKSTYSLSWPIRRRQLWIHWTSTNGASMWYPALCSTHGLGASTQLRFRRSSSWVCRRFAFLISRMRSTVWRRRFQPNPPNPYEGGYAAARPYTGTELRGSLRSTHAAAVGRVRPSGPWCGVPVGEGGPGSPWRHQW